MYVLTQVLFERIAWKPMQDWNIVCRTLEKRAQSIENLLLSLVRNLLFVCLYVWMYEFTRIKYHVNAKMHNDRIQKVHAYNRQYSLMESCMHYTQISSPYLTAPANSWGIFHCFRAGISSAATETFSFNIKERWQQVERASEESSSRGRSHFDIYIYRER